MASNWFELSTHCAVLPAFFVGRMERGSDPDRGPFPTDEEMQRLPGRIVRITHISGGHCMDTAAGVGIFLPLSSSPLSGPFVDLLRHFGEYNGRLFLTREEQAVRLEAQIRNVLNPPKSPDLTGNAYRADEKVKYDLMLQKFKSKYPNLSPIANDFYEKYIHRVAFTGGDDYTDSIRRDLDDLIANFAKLPRTSAQSREGLVQFESTIEDAVLDWPCLDRNDPLGFLPFAEKTCFNDLRLALGGEESLASYLLWENCD